MMPRSARRLRRSYAWWVQTSSRRATWASTTPRERSPRTIAEGRKRRILVAKSRMSRIAKKLGQKDRCVGIWMTGVLPGVNFGVECAGCNMAALKWMRGKASTLIPGGGDGAREDAIFSLHPERDPARNHVAPCVVRYAKEVWMATDATQCGPKVLRAGPLFEGVREVCEQHSIKPRRTGPLSSMLACLKVIGWTMRDPTHLIDRKGEVLDLAAGSPALLQEHIFEAIEDLHHRAVVKRIARKGWGDEEDQYTLRIQGPDLDTIRKVVRGHKLSFAARKCVTQVAAGSYVVASTLLRNGVEVLQSCPFCKQAPDTALRVIWACQELEILRREHFPEHILQWARGAGADSILASFGVGATPVKTHEKVAQQSQIVWVCK
jgi:hypothetical protein